MNNTKVSAEQREGYLWSASKQYMHGEINAMQLETIEQLYSTEPEAERQLHSVKELRTYVSILLATLSITLLVVAFITFLLTRDLVPLIAALLVLIYTVVGITLRKERNPVRRVLTMCNKLCKKFVLTHRSARPEKPFHSHA